MFWHAFYYYLKSTLRQKENLCWTLLFPIALGTMFFVAFSGLSDEESLHTIPVAAVVKEEDIALKSVLDTLGEAGEDQFLEVTYASEEEALDLLQNKEIIGILHGGSPVTLSVNAQMDNMQMEQSILSAFVDQYNAIFDGIKNVAMTNPEKVEAVIRGLSEETDYNKEITYTDGTMDEMVSYFFNLIAMTCLYASMTGLKIAIRNQANLSALGARRTLSPTHRLISILGEITACILFQTVIVWISLFYLGVILKVNFGSQTGYMMLASLVGCMFGISFGFFVGCIGKMEEAIKVGILMVLTMFNCFLSGLMVHSMRIQVEKICPWYNKINPAALISDSFYALSVFQSHDRYFGNLATLFAMAVCLCVAGFFIVRREKYATL